MRVIIIIIVTALSHYSWVILSVAFILFHSLLDYVIDKSQTFFPILILILLHCYPNFMLCMFGFSLSLSLSLAFVIFILLAFGWFSIYISFSFRILGICLLCIIRYHGIVIGGFLYIFLEPLKKVTRNYVRIFFVAVLIIILTSKLK